jgi:hypothetical protein
LHQHATATDQPVLDIAHAVIARRTDAPRTATQTGHTDPHGTALMITRRGTATRHPGC